MPFGAEEKTYEEFLLQIPAYAYSGKTETSETVRWGDYVGRGIPEILFDGLVRDGKLQRTEEFIDAPSDAEIAAGPRISQADVNSTFERLFGPGSAELLQGKTMISTGQESLYFFESEGYYTYVPYSFAGGDHAVFIQKTLLRTEESDGEVVLYIRYAEIPDAASCKTSNVFFVHANHREEPKVLLRGTVSDETCEAVRDAFLAGKADEYLPVYKHTFRANGDGTYYWAETTVDQEGTPFSLTLLEDKAAETDPTEATDVSDTERTDTATEETVQTAPQQPVTTNTEAISDPSETTRSDSPATQSRFPLLWVILGVCAVLLCGGVFLLLRKKKQS